MVLITTLVFIQWLAGLIVWLLILGVIIEWLLHFNILNPQQYIVSVLSDFLYKMTTPILRPIRMHVPSYNGLDFSPLIAIFALFILDNLINIIIMNI